jgi:hypothetical protein
VGEGWDGGRQTAKKSTIKQKIKKPTFAMNFLVVLDGA